MQGGRTRQNDKDVEDGQPIEDGSLDRYDLKIYGDLRIVVIPRSKGVKVPRQGHDPGDISKEPRTI